MLKRRVQETNKISEPGARGIHKKVSIIERIIAKKTVESFQSTTKDTDKEIEIYSLVAPFALARLNRFFKSDTNFIVPNLSSLPRIKD